MACYSDVGGVTNLGLEGLDARRIFCQRHHDQVYRKRFVCRALPLGLLAAVIAGALFSLLHAFASINLKADQVISGYGDQHAGQRAYRLSGPYDRGSGNVRIMMGHVRKNISGVVKDSCARAVVLFAKLLEHLGLSVDLGAVVDSVVQTSFGLRLRACGEHPSAVASAGISVHAMRYFGVIMSGALAGLGGGVILITYSGEFNGSVAGLGFLSIAAVIFGQWKPLGILGATFFFGIATTIANVSQVIPQLGVVPPVLFKVFPYVVTLLALVAFSKKSAAPKLRRTVLISVL